MPRRREISPGEWPELEQEVAERVKAGLAANSTDREPTIVFLRALERTARKEHALAQTIQIISSGRRLLGDRTSVLHADGQ